MNLGTYILSCVFITSIEGSKLNGSHLRVAGIGFPPFLNLASSKNGIPSGVDTDILKILAKKLNLTIEFQPTRTWGIFQKGVWLGTIGKIFNGTADVGIGHMTFNSQRAIAVDLSVPLYFLNIKFYTRRPQPLPQHFNLMKPFTITSWLGISLSVTFVLLISTFFTRVSDDAISEESDLSMNVLLMMGSFVGQSIMQSRPKWLPVSRHVFLISALFFTSFTLMFFQCNLRAYLMSVDFDLVADSAEDLVSQDRRLYARKGPDVNTIFQKSESPYFQKLHSDMIKYNLFYQAPSLFLPKNIEQKVLETGAAIVTTQEMILAQLPNIEAKFGYNPYRLSKENFILTYSGFAFSKESELKLTMNPMLQSLQEFGIIQRLISDNLPREHEHQDLNQEEQLKLDHLLFATIVLVIALVIATICFLIELAEAP